MEAEDSAGAVWWFKASRVPHLPGRLSIASAGLANEIQMKQNSETSQRRREALQQQDEVIQQ